MKKTLLTLLTSLLFLTGFCQDAEYLVRGRYFRPLPEQALTAPKTILDFIPGYPVNWVTSYISVEVMATQDGKLRKANSATETLNTEQKNILKTAEVGTNIMVNVRYKHDDLLADENHRIHVSMTVVPDIEAEYAGGDQQMRKYLKENVTNKIAEAVKSGQTLPKQIRSGTVVFTVNEEGQVVNTRMSKTSGDPKIDTLLMDAINKMPKWKPAQNAKGVKVKQEFTFDLGNGDGC